MAGSLQKVHDIPTHQVAAQDAPQDPGQAAYDIGTLPLTMCRILMLPEQVQVCRIG